jgi:hypothetical protein
VEPNTRKIEMYYDYYEYDDKDAHNKDYYKDYKMIDLSIPEIRVKIKTHPKKTFITGLKRNRTVKKTANANVVKQLTYKSHEKQHKNRETNINDKRFSSIRTSNSLGGKKRTRKNKK